MRQRVDEAGHVELTDAETQRLSRTKLFCGIIIFGGIMVSLIGRVVFGAMVICAVVAALCKASELIWMDELSSREKLRLICLCIVCQVVGFSSLMSLAFAAADGKA